VPPHLAARTAEAAAMVQAKTELKARARELRRAGKTYDEIVAELGVAKSSVSLWVRDQDVADLGKTTLKRHNPKTVRKNVGAEYRGCLVVRVLQGADLYRRIEGWWSGIVCEARKPRRANRT
ncbi:MAG: hypothetical protein ACRDOV_06655, partial [Streptomyces sp.]